MSQIKSSRNGHGYLDVEGSVNGVTIRVDEDKKDFLKRNAKKINYDYSNDKVMYRIERGVDAGRHTTLAKRLYATFKARKPVSEITKPVNFKNGNKNDFRVENLTTKRV